VRGQIAGGAVQGMGYSLFEEIILEQGRIVNPNFSSYVLPTSLDAPEMEFFIIEDPEPSGPFGAKGLGEAALLPTAAAIINAIDDAVGVRISSLPATPEKVLAAL
jgi:nicotinate dehydrogenase medium molybdopterin subunit